MVSVFCGIAPIRAQGVPYKCNPLLQVGVVTESHFYFQFALNFFVFIARRGPLSPITCSSLHNLNTCREIFAIRGIIEISLNRKERKVYLLPIDGRKYY